MAKRGVRDPEGTKRAVLEVAEIVFAERGFAGTSVREVARRSGVSGPLILFHFESKEGLYKAVKNEIVRRWSESQKSTGEDEFSGSTRGFFRHLLQSTFTFYKENPTMIRMANWSRLEGDDEPWGEEDEFHKRYVTFIREAQKRGDIRSDIAPMTMTVALQGAIHIWWEFRGHIKEHVKRGNYQPVSDEEYIDQLLDLLMTGLKAPADDKDKGGART